MNSKYNSVDSEPKYDLLPGNTWGSQDPEYSGPIWTPYRARILWEPREFLSRVPLNCIYLNPLNPLMHGRFYRPNTKVF